MEDYDSGRSQPGGARSPGVSVQDVLRRESQTQAVPAPLLKESYEFLGDEDIPFDRYTSHAFHRREVEHLWLRVWQLACRVDDIPHPGDQLVYDIADLSVLVVRGEDGKVRAFPNACLHRGRLLRSEPGRAPSIRCPFHGWNWTLDGQLKALPSDWDFPHVDKAKFCLPKIHVAEWRGMIFVSMADVPLPFETFIAELESHFAAFPEPPHGRRKIAHVAAIVDCNWKVAMEAFVEGYHGPATHPQMAYYVGDVNTQYDTFGDHVSRMISLEAVPSPIMTVAVPVAQTLSTMAYDLGVGMGDDVPVAEGQSARDAMANHLRGVAAMATGADTSGLSNAEVLEAVQYHLFPNIMPWAGILPMIYRFRPNGDDVNSCIVDLMLLAPAGPQPVDAPAVRWLERNPDWCTAFEFGALGPIFNQDMQNLPLVQKGMRASRKAGATLANYQEIRVRQIHRTLDKYLEGTL